MDFMKVLDQTVREIKREVNLKVLKVPEMEQKVLDATSDEPWGPHGSALTEIAQGTKKFTECQMIMNVLWTRLTDTGANWRHVYKALAVIEYLIANGSERAVDDIIEHIFRISSISGFEYVEPNGKDVGINVRKKVETILALLNDKEKIQAIRNKAAANRDKYFGLSSTGITYKSSSASYGSSSSGGFGSSREGDSFRDSYKNSEQYGKETKWSREDKDNKSKEGLANDNKGSKLKKGVANHAGSQGSVPSNSSKASAKPDSNPSSKSSSTQPNNSEEDFDDFDPRGSSTAVSANANSKLNLFGESLVVDLMDAPTSSPTDASTLNKAVTHDVDLFADATFVSASPSTEAMSDARTQDNIDLFAGQPAFAAAVPANVDLFAASDSGLPSETKSFSSMPTDTKTFDPFAASDSVLTSDTKFTSSKHTNTKAVDPFATIPVNSFDGTDLFGAFTTHTEPATVKSSQNSTTKGLNNLDQTFLASSKPATKKDTFQVKSGIWADSLSRGLIDLNITAPKKTNLADIGIMGGLGDGSDEKEKGPPASLYMGRAMGAGSGMGRPGFSSTTTGGSGSFSTTLGQQQYGGFK